MIPITLREFIEEHRNDDVRQLALEANRYVGVDMRAALVQISGWQKACEKLPSWARLSDIIYPEKLSLEQCSSEATSLYKLQLAERLCPIHHDRLTDLTGGLAVDGSMLARHFSHYLYVERLETLCDIANHNLPLLGIKNFEVVNGCCEDVIPTLPIQDLIYADPARRDDIGRKVVGIRDCTPDMTLVADELLSKCSYLMIKLSPMIEAKTVVELLPRVVEVHVVALDGECKEVLLVMQGKVMSEGLAPLRMYAVNIKSRGTDETFVFEPAEERSSEYFLADKIDEYLYEPNAAVMKAGAYKLLARTFGVGQLDAKTHLYTSEHLMDDFPGRKFKVVEVTDFSKKALKSFFAGLSCCNLSVRNFPATVAELRKRLNMKEGGDDYVFATTFRGSKMLVKCRKTSM